MRHITILYGPDETGKQYVCQHMGWTELVGTADEIKLALEANTYDDELAICIIEDAEDIRDKRVVIHEHARNNGYIVRYIDFRI
jgi:hypothetical protein